MVDLFTTPPAGKKMARAKALLKRDDTVRALESLLAGIDEFDPRQMSSKARYEVEALITECVADLNRQPVVRSLFEKLTKSSKASIPYAPGQEQKLRGILGILHKALNESAANAQQDEQDERLQRKNSLQQKGLESLKAGDLPRGKASLRILAEEFGQEPGLLVQIAEWMLEYKIYFEAAEILEQAIESFPKDSKAYGLAAQCYRTIRELEKAETVYLKAIQRFGKHPRTLLNLAKLYVEWNKKDKAFETAFEAWKKDETLTEAKEIADKYG
jgi:tetratricopeptide (TPR) repeat protein